MTAKSLLLYDVLYIQELFILNYILKRAYMYTQLYD